MKKYLFIALAAFGFAACAEKIDDTQNPSLNGEVEESYIAINLMSADADTRADGDPLFPDNSYQEGNENERKVKTAYFFFYKDGVPFVVNAEGSANTGASNHRSVTISDQSTSGMPNVSDIKEAVLILNNYKGQYPNQVVAVLNWTPNQNIYELAQLHNELLATTVGNPTDGFVMSNSVYMDKQGKIVDTAPITSDNIKKTEAEAKADGAAVEIYVERVASKVVLTASGLVSVNENIYDTSKSLDILESDDDKVYVELCGWELFNDYQSTNLLKNIDTSWDETTIGLTWNDMPYFRSYWAISQYAQINDSFSWSYTNKPASYETMYGFKVGSCAYCAENTNPVVKTGDVITADPRTKVILKGKLMQKVNEEYNVLELARWYGNYYAGQDNLKKAVASTMAYTIFSSEDGIHFTSIQFDDLQCVNLQSVGEAYEASFQLSTTGQEKTWYKYSSEKGYEKFAVNDGENPTANAQAANKYLESIEPAMLYTNGQTYYIVDIRHLGKTGTDTEYGLVRNHLYQIDIQGIKGYGTPVVSINDQITKPETPVEQEASYVAAKINVLSWKIVSYGVNVGQ